MRICCGSNMEAWRHQHEPCATATARVTYKSTLLFSSAALYALVARKKWTTRHIRRAAAPPPVPARRARAKSLGALAVSIKHFRSLLRFGDRLRRMHTLLVARDEN